MFKAVFLLPIFCGLAVSAYGQLSPDLIANLQSSDWKARQKGFRALVDEKALSHDEEAALAALLLRELAPMPDAPQVPPELDQRPDNDHLIDPAREQYIGSLVTTVMAIADKDPDVPGVWPALLGMASYDGHSGMMPWLASHSGRTAPYFLACAKGEAPCRRPYNALVGLAKIINYERDPSTQHHLSSSDVQTLNRTIREKLDETAAKGKPREADELMRMQAIEALGVIGDDDDLKLLERIAATDPYYDSENHYYPYRFDAATAASVLRKRLAAQKNGNQ
jgi:hypothetical protein